MLNEGVAALVFECGSGLFWAGFTGYDASHAEFPLVVGRTRMFGILVSMDQKDCHAFSCYSHLCATTGAMVMVCVHIQVADTPFVTQWCIPMVLVTMEIPQLRVDTVVDGLHCRSCSSLS